MKQTTPPTDQKAQTKPIAFMLDRGFQFDDPVILNIRPEDLTRNEPSRATVHQTLGREVSGWVDDFGEALPNVTIAGHTGWGAGGKADGVKAFEALNNLIVHELPKAKQDAIDFGADPATVKLLFIDVLDGFAWNVKHTQFVLRRSKSRPLLFQYNISLQAISTNAENLEVILPKVGSKVAGVKALTGVLAKLKGFIDKIKKLVATAVNFINAALAPIAATIKKFMKLTADILKIVADGVSGIKSMVASAKNFAISIATDLSKIGSNIFKTLSAIVNLPSDIKSDLMQVGSAFNEAFCILKNSLKPEKTHEDYSSLYGASNCSSTTGGNPASVYADKNSFELMQDAKSEIPISSASLSSIKAMSNSDPVLSPMPIQEMDRHLTAINLGMAA